MFLAPIIAQSHWREMEDFFSDSRLEDHISGLYEGRDVSPIPMMESSGWTGRIYDFTSFILPDFSKTSPNVERGTGGRARPNKARGRASQLRERARKIREKEMNAGNSIPDTTDSYSGTGSEDLDRYSSISSSFGPSLSRHSSQGLQSEDPQVLVPYIDPHKSLQTTATPGSASPFDQGSEVGQFEDADVERIKNQITDVNTQNPENDNDHTSQGVKSQTNSKKSKKIKYTKLDLAEPYEEHQSELLCGVPAGLETAAYAPGTSFIFHDHLPAYRDFQGYVPEMMQKRPKTHSNIDFPSLPKEPNPKNDLEILNNSNNLKGQISPKKNSMKTIASFVTSSEKDQGDQCMLEGVDSSELNMTSQGPVVVLENVPASIDKSAVCDLVRDYGTVSNMRIEKRGDGYTAYLSMEDSETAQWVADILDESDTFLTGGEGTPLRVHVL